MQCFKHNIVNSDTAQTQPITTTTAKRIAPKILGADSDELMMQCTDSFV